MGTSTTMGPTTSGHHRASFIPMPHCSGTLGDCTAIVREQFLYRTLAPYTRTGSTGQSRSVPFSSLMCSRLATQRYSTHLTTTTSPFNRQVPVGPYLSQCITDTCGCNVSPPSSYYNPPSASRLEVTVNAFALQWQLMLLPVLSLEPL